MKATDVHIIGKHLILDIWKFCDVSSVFKNVMIFAPWTKDGQIFFFISMQMSISKSVRFNNARFAITFFLYHINYQQKGIFELQLMTFISGQDVIPKKKIPTSWETVNISIMKCVFVLITGYLMTIVVPWAYVAFNFLKMSSE